MVACVEKEKKSQDRNGWYLGFRGTMDGIWDEIDGCSLDRVQMFWKCLA